MPNANVLKTNSGAHSAIDHQQLGLCAACNGSDWVYAHHSQHFTCFACENCGFAKLSSARTDDNVIEMEQAPEVQQLEPAHVRRCMERAAVRLLQNHGPALAQARVVLIDAGCHGAEQRSRVSQMIGTAKELTLIDGKHIQQLTSARKSIAHDVDVIMAFRLLETHPDPRTTLMQIRDSLSEHGVLVLSLPLSQSSARTDVSSSTVRPVRGVRNYFSQHSIQSLLLDLGFKEISFGDFPENEQSPTCVTARKSEKPERPLLSVVMPVFNEAKTFEECFEAVYAKQIPGVEKEIVIVESNSTDGSRQMVENIENRPGVRVLYQDRPRGKGHAVREGLRAARGDIILIQDADLEYDVEDYDALIRPLLDLKAAFVLGSRHAASWKMREFTDQPLVASYFNVGHIFFRTLFNLFTGQSLNDPFTMYKVFRRDCLYGLEFEANRFDFDFELAMKLIRRGYRPIEIPVNYNSRSLNEGKKVSAWRDPLTWLRALVRFRFCRLPAVP